MKTVRPAQAAECKKALKALKIAIIEGSTWQYERLLNEATRAGATDEDIDRVAHESIEALLAGAEQPVTQRELAMLLPLH